MYCTPIDFVSQRFYDTPSFAKNVSEPRTLVFPNHRAGKHIAKRHLTGNYSSAGTKWLALSIVFLTLPFVYNQASSEIVYHL